MATATATAAATVLATCMSLTACAAADQTGTPAHRLKVWESGTGYRAAVKAVEADVSRIKAARGASASPAVVKFDCATLGQEVNKDYTNLPTPDHALSTDLSNADVAFFNYVTSCVNHNGAPATMVAINHYLTAGSQAIAAAVARSKVVLG
ncbi:MAG: hypothetical protein ACRDY2_08420 [Acidimicrobiales bacterium]